MFGWPRKSRSISGSTARYSEVLVIVFYGFFTVSPLFMFLRVRNPFLAFLLSYHIRVTLKIQANFRFERYWWFCRIHFWNFFSINIFEVKESIADILTELNVTVSIYVQMTSVTKSKLKTNSQKSSFYPEICHDQDSDSDWVWIE